MPRYYPRHRTLPTPRETLLRKTETSGIATDLAGSTAYGIKSSSVPSDGTDGGDFLFSAIYPDPFGVNPPNAGLRSFADNPWRVNPRD